jgi:hypothetical protein
MDIQVTKMIPVDFKIRKMRFPHHDGKWSWHAWGYVYNTQTGEELGQAMLSYTKGENFALNKKDTDYAIRPGTKCQYLCFENPKTGNEFAITIERARELIKGREVWEDDTPAPYYLILIEELTGEEITVPF